MSFYMDYILDLCQAKGKPKMPGDLGEYISTIHFMQGVNGHLLKSHLLNAF